MNKKIKVLLVCLLAAFGVIASMAFTLGDTKPIKLSSVEIDNIMNAVNEFYEYSNCIASDQSNSGQCSEQLRMHFFGGYDRMGCRIFNDFLPSSSSMVNEVVSNGYFRNSFGYVRALQNTHVQTTIQSVTPYGGEWTKIAKQPKYSASDPDTYVVVVSVKKQLRYDANDKGRTANQSINFTLPGFTISGIHGENNSGSASSSTNSDENTGNYMTRAFQHYANKEYKEALDLFEKQIALCQDPEAYYHSAVMYYKNQGCKGMGYRKRFEKFVESMKIAADHGYDRAKFALNREGIEY